MKAHRIARYFAITAVVAFAAYVLRSFASMLMARQGTAALIATNTYFSLAVNLLAAIIAAALNRRYVFRSALAWGIAIPVMTVLEMLFDILTGMLWQPVLQEILQRSMAYSAEPTVGSLLANATLAFNLTQFTIWAVLAYLFQRFVLYRESLDTDLPADGEEV
ncbi:MAG: hypothetical protein IKL25_01860 [Clostridia bacterium]|nr:hypothetical protein [Clostridia bacterium]